MKTLFRWEDWLPDIKELFMELSRFPKVGLIGPTVSYQGKTHYVVFIILMYSYLLQEKYYIACVRLRRPLCVTVNELDF